MLSTIRRSTSAILLLLIFLFTMSSAVSRVAHAASFPPPFNTIHTFLATIGCTLYAVTGNDICGGDNDYNDNSDDRFSRSNTAAVGLAQNTQRETDNPDTITESATEDSTATQPRIVERIIERVTEVQPLIIQSNGITQEDLDVLENELRKAIARVGSDNATVSSNFRTIAQTQKIDTLQNVTITNATIESGISGITDSDVPDTITASNYLPLTGGTLTGAVTGTDATFTGSLTVSGTQTLSGALTVPYIEATSTTATSTFAGGVNIGSGSLIYDHQTGNVGVGTTSPFRQFSVVGNSYIKGDLTINGNSQITEGGELTVGDKVISDGEIGVGTSSPYAKLAIQNTTTTQTALAIYGTTTQSAPLVDIYDDPTSNTNLFRLTASGSLGLGTTSPSNQLSLSDLLYVGGAATSTFIGNVTVGGNINFDGSFLQNNAEFEASQWTTNGNDIHYNTGNVGIGTTSPAARLDLDQGGLRVFGDVTTDADSDTNTFFGVGAGANNDTTGNSDQNTFIGYQAGNSNTTGTFNVAVGEVALQDNTTSDSNTAVGQAALQLNETGARNTAVGRQALRNSDSDRNTALGYFALRGVTSGSNNIGIGNNAGDNLTTGSNNIILGYDIDAPAADSANTLNIGNLIFGTGIDGTGTTLSSGNVGIGTTSPYAKLSVVGETVSEYFTATSTTATSTFSGGATFATGGGNVGIGATSTQSELHIENSDSDVSLSLARGTNVGNGIILGNIDFYGFDNSVYGKGGTIRAVGDGNWGGASDIPTRLEFRVAGDAGAPVTTQMVIKENGRIGIGSGAVSDPLAGLHVNGGEGSRQGVFIDTDTDGGGDKHALKIRSASDAVVTDADTKFIVLGSGEVGIGTTSPDSLLHIEGSGGSAPFIRLTQTNDANSAGILIKSNVDSFIDFTNRDNNAQWRIGRNQSNNQAFTISNQTGLENARLVVETGGNVGLGTTSPYAKLSVVGEAVFETFNATSTSATSTIAHGLDVGAINQTGSATSTFANGIQLSGGCFLLADGTCAGSGGGSGTINSGTTNRLAYYSGATTLDSADFLSVDTSNSRLGIGTTSPSVPLAVSGADNVGITIDSADSASLVSFTDDTTTNNASVFVGALGNDLIFGAGGGTDGRFDSAGNFGIGEASPSGKLHVSGTGNILSYFESTDGNAAQLRLKTSSTNRRIIAEDGAGNVESQIELRDSGEIRFHGPTTDNRVVFDSSGDIGIGTESPSAKLDVAGSAEINGALDMQANTITDVGQIDFTSGESILDGTNFRFDSNSGFIDFRPSDATHGLLIRDFDGSGTAWSAIRTQDDGSMELRSDGGDYTQLVLDDSGQVGIGTNVVGQKLDVDGTIRQNFTDCDIVANVNGDLTCSGSSIQFKENVSDLEYGLAELRALNPVSFDWKETGARDVGFIAEEVDEIAPLLTFFQDGELYGVKYNEFTALLASAAQEIDNRTAFIENTFGTSTRMYIDEQGNVGVGENPQQYGAGTSTLEHALTVDGDVAATGFVNVSSGDFKRNVKEVSREEKEGMLEKLQGMFVATYEYDREEYMQSSATNATSSSRLGLIAARAPEEVRSSDGKGIDLYKFVTFVASAVQALADQVMGFTERFVTKELCVGETCITEGELKDLLALRSGQTASASTTDSVADTSVDGDTEPPTITINGNNPAEIEVGATYSDLGASVVDPATDTHPKNTNLGLKASVNGEDVGDISNIKIDTSTSSEHTIEYRATDQAGNTGTATRQVVVGDGESEQAPADGAQSSEDELAGDPGTTQAATGDGGKNSDLEEQATSTPDTTTEETTNSGSDSTDTTATTTDSTTATSTTPSTNTEPAGNDDTQATTTSEEEPTSSDSATDNTDDDTATTTPVEQTGSTGQAPSS